MPLPELAPNNPLELTAHSAGFVGCSWRFPLWAAAQRERWASRKVTWRVKMIFIPLLLFSALFATSAIAAEDEYFGEFLDSLRGVFLTDAKPRPKFKLESEFRFKDPNGVTDCVKLYENR